MEGDSNLMNRILHITGKMDRAGAETMIMNLYRHIDRTKFQFDFVSFSDEEGDFDKEIKDLGGIIYHITDSNPIKRMFALRNLLKEHLEYKIIHCHTLLSNAFHLYAGKMAKVPYRISHAHSTNNSSKGKIIDSLYYSFSKTMISKYSTHFISCGHEAGEFLYPSQKNVLFLPNSIDTRCFSEVGQKEKMYLQKMFQLDDDCLKIIQVGRIENVKNHRFSLEIASELKTRDIKFKMFFVGQGELLVEIEKEIKTKKIEKDVLLLGLRSDIPQLMAGSDVMLMPSFHEGFPVVLVESQSVGLPSLISASISKDVDMGVGLVEFESLETDMPIWVEKLVQLKQKEKIDSQIRLSKIAEQGFDIYNSVEILANLYNSLL